MNVNLKPPSPVTTLKPTVIPLTIMRCTMIGDLMTNFGFTEQQARIAQEGYAAGLLSGITIEGLNAAGHIEDEASMWFQALAQEINISVDVSGGRSMIEAVSRKLAHGVSYSVALMRRKGLRINVRYHLTPMGYASIDTTCARLGLERTPSASQYANGYAPRTVFSISPGMDRGTTYSHRTATRIR